jgi:uncharacterized protein YdhG (YjbR/CyaY superfamily)
MKKGKSPKRGSAAKASKAPKNVEEYLATVPESARGNFNKLRAAIQSVVPAEATETISYGTDKPLPVALIKKLVKARVARNESGK